ncbi:hypothetical protein CkaCkLH20_08441 [Colletotrichum karsti]|uniref:Uncharacterized protein n=1 Tax=Colletotrichum karsti TaxID=1095194 RepID=A0A9P6I0K8_9PEZI|nr:uncharacterized protein CkaCkLH20_08441 [Colletotrichum karsti]KAF9874069.1 hypothetical protein CkaCkLH20_08441 [Colletotrichum karsti]
MKFPTTQTLLLALCLSLAEPIEAADKGPSASCSRWKGGIPITKWFDIPLYRRYSIVVKDLKEGEDVPWVCDRLWKELKQFKGSCTVSKPKCEANGPTEMLWIFNVDLGCNKGKVHSAWYDATKNTLGAIDCASIKKPT